MEGGLYSHPVTTWVTKGHDPEREPEPVATAFPYVEHPQSARSTTTMMSMARFNTLPAEIIFWIMKTLSPRNILSLAHVSHNIRILSLTQLEYAHDMGLVSSGMGHLGLGGGRAGAVEAENRTGPTYEQDSKLQDGFMSQFELYVRLVLSDFYHQEQEFPAATDAKDIAAQALGCSKRILRRLYLSESVIQSQKDRRGLGYMFTPSLQSTQSPSPFLKSAEHLHTVARVIADQVCRGICLPETAVLILQALTSLHDHDQFQYTNSLDLGRDASIRLPEAVKEDEVSIGVLCFQYLVPNVLLLLQPLHSSASSPAAASESPIQLHSHILPLTTSSTTSSMSPTLSGVTKSLTSNVLSTQQALLRPLNMRSVSQLSRILCFLPLLGRHFNTLPTTTFIDTFLSRSQTGGDLPIDRAAVMVYGFMCVLDLETGKANLASDSYRIFERSMPTKGRVQAEEIVRTVERHRMLMRAFLHSSPTFSSRRMFGPPQQ